MERSGSFAAIIREPAYDPASWTRRTSHHHDGRQRFGRSPRVRIRRRGIYRWEWWWPRVAPPQMSAGEAR